jgi:hypothetical protein
VLEKAYKDAESKKMNGMKILNTGNINNEYLEVEADINDDCLYDYQKKLLFDIK